MTSRVPSKHPLRGPSVASGGKPAVRTGRAEGTRALSAMRP
jgi:hypothetical protein